MSGTPVGKIVMEASGGVHYLVVKGDDSCYSVLPNKEERPGYPRLDIKYCEPTMLSPGEWKIFHGEDQVYVIEEKKSVEVWELQAIGKDDISFGFCRLRRPKKENRLRNRELENVFYAEGTYASLEFTKVDNGDDYLYHSGLSLVGKPMWDFIVVKPGLCQPVVCILMMLVACGDLVNKNFLKDDEAVESKREVKLETLQAKKVLRNDTENIVEPTLKDLASQGVTRGSFVGPQVLLSPNVFDKLEPIFQGLCGNFPSEKEETQKSGGFKSALKMKLLTAKTKLKMGFGTGKQFFLMMSMFLDGLHKLKDNLDFRHDLSAGQRFLQATVPENLCDFSGADLDSAHSLTGAALDLEGVLRPAVRMARELLLDDRFASYRAELTPEEMSNFKKSLSSLLSFIVNSEDEHKYLLYVTREWIDAAKKGEVDATMYGSKNPEVIRMECVKKYLKLWKMGAKFSKEDE